MHERIQQAKGGAGPRAGGKRDGGEERRKAEGGVKNLPWRANKRGLFKSLIKILMLYYSAL